MSCNSLDNFTIQELMAVFLARQLKDGDHLQVGVALPVPEAAVRLAHIMHGPNMELIFLGTRMNVHQLEQLPLPEFGWDNRCVRWAESYSDRGHRFDQVKDWYRRVFFIGGVQVDRFGNTNLIGIGNDHQRLDFRGPGSVGTATLTTHVGRYYIVLNNHTPRLLVEKCDFISAFGWGDGGADARKRLGIPGGGPQLCITPLCVMDFAEDTKGMRLISVHPGVTVDDVKDATGFPLEISDKLTTTKPPSLEELTILRSRVDPDGSLRS
jgi:glutaconate CoA-transferase subunit B